MFFSKIISRLKNKIKGVAEIPYLEYHVCDHCNLNCAGCDHFCPLVEDEIFTDLEQFSQDIEELSKKLKIKKIRIMGGEPLLNPKLADFIKVTRKFYPKSDIRLVTNGILLPTMEENFWDILRSNNIIIDFSKYPPTKEKFSEYLDLLDDNRIKLGQIHLAKRFTQNINDNGKSNMAKTYKNCFSKLCVNLWHSKIYPCSRCYTQYANDYFGINIKVPEGYDFYKMSGVQLVKKIYRPIDACRYCNTVNPSLKEWKQSKKMYEEWF